MAVPAWTKVASLIYVNAQNVLKSEVRQHHLEMETALNALISTAHGLINGKLAVTGSANVLTVAIKTLAGADPSVADPVYVIIRGAGETDGDTDVLTLTAATSMTVSAGSTLGVSGNSIPFRTWIVGFNDAGTFRLGIINCLAASAATVYPLNETGLISSTAEGGAGAADSAGVIYTGSAVSSKAYAILGFAAWNSGLATVGQWTTPTIIQLFRAGMKKPGDVVQRVRTDSGAVATGTTTVPFDDTIPQIAEGTEFITQAITPQSAANALRVRAQVELASSAAVQAIAALFQDATASALRAVSTKVTAAGDSLLLSLMHTMLAATASATTFRVRAGPSSAATVTFNGSAGGRIFGGVMNSYIEVEEVVG